MRCRGYVASCLFAVALLSRGVLTQQPLAQRKLSSKSSSNASVPTLDSGTISNGVYRSTAFGFTYKLPFGWVNRTKEMSEDSNDDSSADSNRPKSILLLATFERPPEAPGDSVNSAVVVAAEAASSYPGLRNAEQYFGPLTALTKSKGLTVVNEPYEFRVGTMQLLRGDFSKPLGNLTMRQSTLVMMEKGYVVSFTFIGGSEGEVDELMEGLSFGTKAATAVHK
jgi:hypothetical protein